MTVMEKVDGLTQKIDQLLNSPAVAEALGPLEAGVMEAGGKLMANPDVMGEVTGIEQGVNDLEDTLENSVSLSNPEEWAGDAQALEGDF